jgi:hypothetical protein
MFRKDWGDNFSPTTTGYLLCGVGKIKMKSGLLID